MNKEIYTGAKAGDIVEILNISCFRVSNIYKCLDGDNKGKIIYRLIPVNDKTFQGINEAFQEDITKVYREKTISYDLLNNPNSEVAEAFMEGYTSEDVI